MEEVGSGGWCDEVREKWRLVCLRKGEVEAGVMEEGTNWKVFKWNGRYCDEGRGRRKVV